MAYITVNEARAGFLDRDEEYIGVVGTDIRIRSRNAQSIIALKKNGAALAVTTDYTFTAPDTVTLVVAAVAADKFEIKYGILLEDADVSRVLDEVDNMIKSKLKLVYDIGAFTSTPPIIKTIERWITQYLLAVETKKNERYRISDTELATMKDQNDVANQWLTDIINLDMKLLYSDNTVVAPITAEDDEEMYLSIQNSREDETGAEV